MTRCLAQVRLTFDVNGLGQSLRHIIEIHPHAAGQIAKRRARHQLPLVTRRQLGTALLCRHPSTENQPVSHRKPFGQLGPNLPVCFQLRRHPTDIHIRIARSRQQQARRIIVGVLAQKSTKFGGKMNHFLRNFAQK